MNKMIKCFIAGVFLVATMPAQAATCPDQVTSTGTVTVNTTPASSCFATGTGSIDLSPLVLLDKSDDNTSGLLEGVLTITELPATGSGKGTFSIGATPGYTDLTLVIKDGNLGGLQWGAFSLGALTGTWSLEDASGKLKALSHADLWGSVSPVPVPAAVWLFGTALIGFIGFSRRTKV